MKAVVKFEAKFDGNSKKKRLFVKMYSLFFLVILINQEKFTKMSMKYERHDQFLVSILRKQVYCPFPYPTLYATNLSGDA